MTHKTYQETFMYGSSKICLNTFRRFNVSPLRVPSSGRFLVPLLLSLFLEAADDVDIMNNKFE